MASLQPATLISLSMIVVLWGALGFALQAERQRAVESAIQQGSNLVRLFDEDTFSLLRGVDRTLLRLRRVYEKDPLHVDLGDLVKRTTAVEDSTIRYVFAEQDGSARALSHSDNALLAINIGDRSFFQQQRDTKNDNLVIGSPSIGRFSNELSIILSRRLRKPDGSFAGVIAGRVGTEFIQTFYKTIDVGARGNVVLRDLDGIVLASSGVGHPTGVGRRVMQDGFRDALAKSPTGYFWSGGLVDGTVRLVSYRKSRDMSVIMTVGLAKDDVFAGYKHTRTFFVFGGLGVTLLLMLGAIAGIRHQMRITHSSARRKRAELNLERANKFLDTVVESLPLPIVVKDPDTLRFTLVNRAYEAFIGIPRERLIGRTVSEIYPPLNAGLLEDCDREAVNSKGGLIVAEFALPTPTNGLRTVMTTRLAVRDDNGGPSHLIAVIDDITERRESEKKILHMAHHDALTDLPNRALLQERLEQGLTRIALGESLAVMCLDLDDFKAVNDAFGHSIGDALLKSVAERLRSCIAETDTAARFGGDEFTILQILPGDSVNITTLAQRIVDVIHAPHDLGGHPINVGISIGIAVAPNDGVDPDQLIKNADLALYRAKSEGRGSYRFFEPEMDLLMRARHALELDIRSALVNGEFELYYQPFVNLHNNEVCGFEALLRWHHPERGTVSPGEFIPIAEDTGLIVRIGEWALREACSEASTWPQDMIVAVNLSPSQFRSESLVQTVMSALATSGLAGDRLELEITESALLQNNEATREVLIQLRSLGVKISMDDFGTGYSSLGYLQNFPFDKIKIDRSFISNLSVGHSSIAILRAIVSLANSLGMATIAEGVETESQLEIVRAEGCTEMQGFLFSPAKRAAEIARLFMRHTKRAESVA